eukprot:1509069-Pyramimonas_sp.AAC.1
MMQTSTEEADEEEEEAEEEEEEEGMHTRNTRRNPSNVWAGSRCTARRLKRKGVGRASSLHGGGTTHDLTAIASAPQGRGGGGAAVRPPTSVLFGQHHCHN